MAGKTESLKKLSLAISIRYRRLGWYAGLSMVLGLIAYIRTDHPLFLKSIFSAIQWASLLFLVYLIQHRLHMLKSIDRDPDGMKRIFETYMVNHFRTWEAWVMGRLLIGVILAGAMLFMLLFTAERIWSQVLAAWFIVYVLGMALKNWLDFTERILLHDYRRIFGDQPSDISDW